LPLRALRILSALAVAGLATYLIVVRRGSIEHAVSRLGQARPAWIGVAVAAELVSLVCYAALVRVLLSLGSVRVPFRALFSLTVIGVAMINSVPGGQAVAAIYWYEQLRRYSVRRAIAVWALLVATLVGVATLVLLAAIGVAIAGHGFASQARIPVLAVAAVILIAIVAGRRQFVPLTLRAIQRVGDTQCPAEQPVAANHLILLIVLGLLNWFFDASALVATLAAVGQSIPVRGVIIAYSLGQLVSAITILPGGGGTIEATISAGLVVAGGTAAAVIAGVLLYRIISAWGLIPLGWSLWLTLPNAQHGTSTGAAASP
jgi:uncharacterized membrane protein YbhN (UPF0104 family)